jgi:hypothetical protein
MTESISTGERLSALEAKLDQALAEVSLLRAAFVSLEKYLLTHTKDIERVRAEMDLVKSVGVWIFAPMLGTLGLGAIAAIVMALKK